VEQYPGSVSSIRGGVLGVAGHQWTGVPIHPMWPVVLLLGTAEVKTVP